MSLFCPGWRLTEYDDEVMKKYANLKVLFLDNTLFGM